MTLTVSVWHFVKDVVKQKTRRKKSFISFRESGTSRWESPLITFKIWHVSPTTGRLLDGSCVIFSDAKKHLLSAQFKVPKIESFFRKFGLFWKDAVAAWRPSNWPEIESWMHWSAPVCFHWSGAHRGRATRRVLNSQTWCNSNKVHESCCSSFSEEQEQFSRTRATSRKETTTSSVSYRQRKRRPTWYVPVGDGLNESQSI